MSTEVEHLVVDRFEGGSAVLVGADESTIEVDRALLPRGARAGAVLRVQRDGQGEIRWSEVAVDEDATAERLSEAEEILKELRDRDPGGDVVL
jgi:formylmethanofuran dehydrogenase subunit D